MTRQFYHLMGTLDSLLRYLDSVTLPKPPPDSCEIVCDGDYPHPFTAPANPNDPDHIQAVANIECIRRSIQSKAKALSKTLDDMINAREQLFKLALNAYTNFRLSDIQDAMSGSRLRRRTYPQMSFMDVAFALTEKEYNNPVDLSNLSDVKSFLNILRKKAKPAVNYVNALAGSAQNNKLLLDEFMNRRCDLFQALSALNIKAAGGQKSPLEELDPTLQAGIRRLIKILGNNTLVAGVECVPIVGGGGPGDGVWPGPMVNSSSSTSTAASTSTS